MATERSDYEDDGYRLAYTKELLPYCSGRVLDIGCGLGYVSRDIANLDRVTQVVGTDKFAETTVDLGCGALVKLDTYRRMLHPKFMYLGIPTELLITQWATKDSFFDTIVSTEHIEHLSELVQYPLLEWISEHLNPEGKFLGSMPDTNNSGNPFHKKEYRKEDWETILKQFFEEVRTWKTPSYEIYVWVASHPKTRQPQAESN